MKKILAISVVFFLLISCDTSRQLNRTEDMRGNIILYGKTDRTAFEMPEFSRWFNPEYQNYKAGQVYLDELKTYTDKISEIIIVHASWCPDARRELPRFLKIADYMQYPEKNIKMYAIDYNRTNDVKEFEDIKFTRIPTLIFYDGKNEIGRIIEQPEMTLEEDMVAMFRLYYGN